MGGRDVDRLILDPNEEIEKLSESKREREMLRRKEQEMGCELCVYGAGARSGDTRGEKHVGIT